MRGRKAIATVFSVLLVAAVLQVVGATAGDAATSSITGLAVCLPGDTIVVAMTTNGAPVYQCTVDRSATTLTNPTTIYCSASVVNGDGLTLTDGVYRSDGTPLYVSPPGSIAGSNIPTYVSYTVSPWSTGSYYCQFSLSDGDSVQKSFSVTVPPAPTRRLSRPIFGPFTEKLSPAPVAKLATTE